MIGGLSRTFRVKRVNMESSLFFVNDVIFRELWNSKRNYRDSWFAIFNSRELCAWPPPYGPSYKQREPKKPSGYLAARPSTAQIRLYPAPLIFWEYYIPDLATEPFSIGFTVLKKKKDLTELLLFKKDSGSHLVKTTMREKKLLDPVFFFSKMRTGRSWAATKFTMN